MGYRAVLSNKKKRLYLVQQIGASKLRKFRRVPPPRDAIGDVAEIEPRAWIIFLQIYKRIAPPPLRDGIFAHRSETHKLSHRVPKPSVLAPSE